MSSQKIDNDDPPFKSLFLPITTFKAIHIFVIVGFLVFSNMLFNGFVLDDKVFIINNPELHEFDISKLIGINLFNGGAHYRPIPAIYFASLYSMFKELPFFYHLPQLLLHIVNCSFIFLLFRKFFPGVISLYLALLFLVHPMQVESVSYIAASISPLFFVFGIIAVLLSLNAKISYTRLTIIFLLILFSILTKETGFLFLLMLVLYKLLYQRKHIFHFVIGGVLTSLTYIFLRFGTGIYFERAEMAPITRLSLEERVLNIPAIIYYYIKTFFYPSNLTIEQHWIVSNTNYSDFYLPLIVVVVFFILLGLFGIYIANKKRQLLKIYTFFLVWFLCGLFLHVQFFPLDMTVADRWFYFPIVGLLGILGLAIYSLSLNTNNIKSICYSVLVILIVLLSVRSISRNADWSNALELYLHDSKVHTNFNIENNIGSEYERMKDYNNALEHYKKSVQMFSHEGNVYNIGAVYEQKGDLQTAKVYYYQALKEKNYLIIHPHTHNRYTYVKLARILYLTEKQEVTRDFIKNALKDYPDSPSLWVILAVTEYQLRNQSQALEAITKAKTIHPTNNINQIYENILNKKEVELNL